MAYNSYGPYGVCIAFDTEALDHMPMTTCLMHMSILIFLDTNALITSRFDGMFDGIFDGIFDGRVRWKGSVEGFDGRVR